MENTTVAYFEFDSKLNQLYKKKELRHGLSATVQIGNTLWIANDETLSLERLTFTSKDNEGNCYFTNHKQFYLQDFLSLPAPPTADDLTKGKFQEADIEGLDYQDGYLWLVGSHSLKRSKIDKKDVAEDCLDKFAEISKESNRYLLARIPVVKEDDTYTLVKEVTESGKQRTAALVKANQKGNQLTKKLSKDEYLKAFFSIPGKENGFDIEGIAIAEDSIFLGMRGPVLRGWATILEIKLKKAEKKNSTELKVKNIQKYFLQLDGLGIRDLCIFDSKLLILTGPTMDLDGPVSIFRWNKALDITKQQFVFKDDLEVVMNIPYGQGVDHAEGISLFSANGSDPDSILVVYDSASENRYVGQCSIKADIFPLR